MAELQPARGQRRGSAMIGALFVVMTVSVLSVAYLQLSISKNKEGRGAVDSKRAFYMAEAGLSESFTAIRMGRSGNVGSAEEPAAFAHGVFWVEATEQGDDTVLLRSTGLCGTGRSSLAVVVDRTAESIPGLGVFADQDVVVGPGGLVDSYDSRNGQYDEQEFDPYRDRRWKTLTGDTTKSGTLKEAGGFQLATDGDERTKDELSEWYSERLLDDIIQDLIELDPTDLPIASRVSSNGDVTLESAGGGPPTMILGDVQPGPTGTVMEGSGSLVSGATTPADEHIFLPPIEVPVYTARGDVTHSGARPLIVPVGEGSYGTLRVSSGSTLVLRGPLELVVEEFVVDPGATLIIETEDGEVGLFVTEYFGLESGSMMAEGSKRPDQAAIIVTAPVADRDDDGTDDDPVTLLATGELHAIFYAPHAELVVPSALEVFGSIAGRSLEISANGKVHFDMAVAAVVSKELSYARLRSWRFVSLPDEPIVRSTMDPNAFLAIGGITPPIGQAAYADTMLDITYLCVDGHTHTYQGAEHLFDTSQVQTTLTQSTSPAPAGELSPPINDYELIGFGHATAGARSPFTPLGMGGV